ncbi:capsid cement protein [Marinobacterium litorale]|uniref:capsid cement protein n=1 Tax=Marinobacterium litorale TaxID=404770 RepID=UPI0004250D86|nr:capsid cement protein [Marinobacterium litorale]
MSSQFISLLGLTRTASGAVTAQRFVSPTNAVATAAGNTLGVARTKAADGEEMLVDVIGTAVVVADGAVSDGDELEVGTAGAATVQSAGVTVARALEDAADGEPFEVLLIAN